MNQSLEDVTIDTSSLLKQLSVCPLMLCWVLISCILDCINGEKLGALSIKGGDGVIQVIVSYSNHEWWMGLVIHFIFNH
jgi:hypothetical protein